MSESKKVLSAVSAFVVYNQDGSLNREATSAALLSQISAEIEESRQYDEVIGAAVHYVFDQLPAGMNVPTSNIVSLSAGYLAQGDMAKQLFYTPMIGEYVKRSPHFQAKRGRSGGLQRVSKP